MAADESGAPRHGRHSAAARHAASRPVPEVGHEEPLTDDPSDGSSEPKPQHAPAPAVPEAVSVGDNLSRDTDVVAGSSQAVPEVVPIADGDQETSMGDAPRPIGVDPSETGSFTRIDASEGARLTTRANASETASFTLGNSRPMEVVRMSRVGRPTVRRRETEVKANTRVLAVLGACALVVVLMMGWLVTRALVSVDRVPEETVSEQVQASGDEGIEYRGSTYTLSEQETGAYALTSSSEGSEGKAVLCELQGVPVSLILYNTVFVIPENLDDGTWDLIAYPFGGGSVTQQVTDADGKAIVGTGKIVEATLQGDSIQIVTDIGGRVTISLV
ncbi:MAG: hypothetical protein QM302_02885 [Acidobacteriota bacterium]|nr:hypothetical protein [Acidobacteriota bacterium]